MRPQQSLSNATTTITLIHKTVSFNYKFISQYRFHFPIPLYNSTTRVTRHKSTSQIHIINPHHKSTSQIDTTNPHHKSTPQIHITNQHHDSTTQIHVLVPNTNSMFQFQDVILV
ncbi:hypothetical protein LINPERHAP2_LOCUS22850 [Linum perenne]